MGRHFFCRQMPGKNDITMGKFIEKIKNGTVWASKSVVELPIEAFLSAVAFAAALMATTDCKWFGQDVLMAVLTFFVPMLILTFSAHRFSGRYPALKIAYYASPLLLVPVMLWLPGIEGGAWTATIYLLSIILLFYVRKNAEDQTYSRNLIHILLAMAVTVFTAGILTGLVCAIMATVEALFGINFNDAYEYVFEFCGLFISPLLMLKLITREEDVINIDKFVTILIKFIFTPALIIYTVILYLYIIKIAVKWELPDGGVTYMVLGFLALALVCRLVHTQTGSSRLGWFYKYLPLVALPPLVLQWIGMTRRLCEYGFTESRVYLVVSTVLVSLFVLMLIKERLARFQPMTIIIGCAFFIFTFIPGISARHLGILSQQRRLEKVLPDVLVDGVFPDNFDYVKIKTDNTLKERYMQAHDSYEYLEDEMDSVRFEKKYGAYGKLNLDTYQILEENTEADCSFFYFRGDIDIAGYKTMLSGRTYKQVYNGNCVEIWMGDELMISCDLEERLDSTQKTDKDAPAEMFIFENERCKVVFYNIDDWRPEGNYQKKMFTASVKAVLVK